MVSRGSVGSLPTLSESNTTGYLNLISAVNFNGADLYCFTKTLLRQARRSIVATSLDGSSIQNSGDVTVPAGYSLLTATTTTVDEKQVIFSIWQNGTSEYYGTSTDGTDFSIDGALNVPANFTTSSVVIANGELQLYGTDRPKGT